MALRVPKSKFWDHFYRPKPPPKPPFRPSRNPNRTSKSDFWPFYWFLPFSHWNSHCNRKKLRTAEGVVLQQKQKVFRNLWTKWNNMKPCWSWINQIFWIRITLMHRRLFNSPFFCASLVAIWWPFDDYLLNIWPKTAPNGPNWGQSKFVIIVIILVQLGVSPNGGSPNGSSPNGDSPIDPSVQMGVV